MDLIPMPELVEDETCHRHPSSAAFTDSIKMTENVYAAATTIPTELLADHFPEGSVLHVMPQDCDGAIVCCAVAARKKSFVESDSVIFKDSNCFVAVESSDHRHRASNHLLTGQSVEPRTVVLNAEVEVETNNMEDIDLSFLNEETAIVIPDSSKCLNGEDRLLTSTSPPPHSSVNLSSQRNDSVHDGTTEAESVVRNNPTTPSRDEALFNEDHVVFIDVTKPIQLSHNSLVTVNGQKCVLQHDTHTGRVLAYPVQEQGKPRRKRGRPKKQFSTKQQQCERESDHNTADNNTALLEEEQQSGNEGLLQVLNDDGTFVRRSSRKRKTAKVLRDYETGNLRRELGSDADDVVEILDDDNKDVVCKKKSTKGPGRPRKNASEMDLNTGTTNCHQRGRRRKQISAESEEATQAFLVQTADGQTLMMQVPLSSIPPGIGLQEMAQEIADKLNLGLNQATTNELKTSPPKATTVSELALQDHSVGSTTAHFIPLNDSASTTVVHSSCRDIIITNQSAAKVITEDETANSISSNQNNFSTLEVCSEDVVATTSADNVSTCVGQQLDPLTDHDFGLPRSNAVLQVSKNVVESAGIMQKQQPPFDKEDHRTKRKVSVKLLLPNKDTHSNDIPKQDLLDKNSKNTSEFIFNTKELTETFLDDKPMEPYTTLCFSKATEDINCDDTKTVLERNTSLQMEGSELDKSILHVTTSPRSDHQTLEVLLSLEKISSSSIISDDTVVSSSSSTPVSSDKDLPIHLSAAKQCKICHMPYLKDEEIVQHFKMKHPKCICTDCNYMNEHPYVIKRHAFRHANNGCICKICNKKYKDVYILKMHIKMVHLPPDVLYACEVCDKKFTRKAHLKRHLRIHASVKQYQCPHCDYKGCEKSDITKHLLIHEAPKFKCEICGKAFRHVKNKELHLKRHSGQRDYKCAACGFFGYTYTDIRKHIERRHSVSCPQCKQVFTDSQLLKEHKRVGSCHVVDEIKVLENPTIAVVSEEAATFLEEMPLNIL